MKMMMELMMKMMMFCLEIKMEKWSARKLTALNLFSVHHNVIVPCQNDYHDDDRDDDHVPCHNHYHDHNHHDDHVTNNDYDDRIHIGGEGTLSELKKIPLNILGEGDSNSICTILLHRYLLLPVSKCHVLSYICGKDHLPRIIGCSKWTNFSEIW